MLLVGLPGSGKSTYVEKLGATALASDEIRRLLSDDPENQNIHRRVFGVLRDLLKQRIELDRPVTYIDATNLTPYERRPYIELAKLYEHFVKEPARALALTDLGTGEPAEALSRRRARLNLCRKCNYDRTGLALDAVCPECGSSSA